MASYVELEDGTRLPLARLPERTPHSCYMSKLHAQVCQRLARQSNVPAEMHDVYVNSMFKRSPQARQLTALVVLLRAGKLAARKVHAPFLDGSFADLLEGVEILPAGGRPGQLLPARMHMRGWFKMLAHRGYRLFRRRKLQSEEVTRAWVETTDHVFPEEVQRSTLLVYPFHGWWRQCRYVRRCRHAGRSLSLMGIPYRLRDLVRLAWPGGERDRRLIEAEIRGYERHAQELLAMGVCKLYTTDEWESASCRLHAALLERGVWTCNRAHGVASYGPFVVYSHFSFYDERQRDYYHEWGRFETSDLLMEDKRPKPALKKRGGEYDPVVIVLQGNWRHARKRYEAAFEEMAIDRAKDTCRALGLPLVIKPHPDLGLLRPAWLKRRFGLPLVQDLETLAGRYPVFLNTASSAYRTYLATGPTVFLFDDFHQARTLFGEGIHGVPLEELPAELARFRAAEYWHQRLAAQIELETAGV